VHDVRSSPAPTIGACSRLPARCGNLLDARDALQRVPWHRDSSVQHSERSSRRTAGQAAMSPPTRICLATEQATRSPGAHAAGCWRAR